MNATYSNSKNCTNASCTEGKECNKCNQRRKGKGKMGTCGNCNDPATHAVLHAHEWRQGTGINKIASTIKRHWHDVLHEQRRDAHNYAGHQSNKPKQKKERANAAAMDT
ncbi:hypothetical protein MBANPS3_005942 [Mucor bainieri]